MKRSLATLFVLLSTSSLACGAFLPQAGSGETQPKNAAYEPPKESKDLLRKQNQAAYALADDAEDESLDALEKSTLKAFKQALGKEAAFQGQPVPESSSTVLKALRAARFKLRLEPVTDGDGKAINDDFIQLKDSFTDRVQQLQRKMVEQTASRAEMKEIQDGSKQVMKLQDLRSQVMAVSMVAMNANNHVQSSSLQQMLRVAGLVRSYKMMNMELEAGDYALVKRGLERQKRAEAIAATTMAMLAAYQAVINDNGDPKALDIIAEGTLKAFPIKVELTDEDGKGYVRALGENVTKVKSRYESMLRKVHGDARYNKYFKTGIDAMFAQAEGAQSQKSVGEMVNDMGAKYNADIVKCKRGEDPGPGSMASGPTCKAVFRAAQSGDTSGLSKGAKQAFEATGGATAAGGATASAATASAANGGASAVNAVNAAGVKLPAGQVGAAIGLAGAVANGDVDGALDSAAKLFPGDSTIGASLQGIAALKKGDARGAISAALTFVPVPGLKDTFGFASKLLFKT